MDALRKSVIAGSWYPGNPSVLRRDIEGFLNLVPDTEIAGEVVANNKGIKIVNNGKERTLEHPKVDPYWILAAEFSK